LSKDKFLELVPSDENELKLIAIEEESDDSNFEDPIE
jgi:hypothetical protein